VLALGGCTIVTDSDNDGRAPTGITVHAVKADGEVRMSGSLSIDAGKLKLAVAAIRDPDAPTRPADPAKVSFAVSAAATEMACTVGRVSAASKAAVDLVFINDTTGSMSGTVEGISKSASKFAEDVAAGGVDARFSMYTYGDAFATVPSAPGSENPFKVGKGDFAPPEFDGDARPYIGLSDVAGFKSFLTEMESSSALGVGGGDGEENTLGALHYANGKVAWRDGAARMFVAIGDNPSHQKGSADELFASSQFAPPSGDDLIASINGSAVIHVVGHDRGEAPFYNLKHLADKSGGVFLELPSDGVVDLGALNLKDWLTASFAGACDGAKIGRYTIVVKATVNGSKTGTLTFDAELR
jgi:hypothetical protein